MKSLFTLIVLIFSSLSFANHVLIGCNEQKLFCPPDRECLWMTNIGQAGEVQLTQSYSGPDYEIWKGIFSGYVYGKYPFEASVTQRVFIITGEKVNSLSLRLVIDDSEVLASGNSRVSAKYKKDELGVGFICTTELEDSESNFQ